MTAKEVYDFLDSAAPFASQDGFDNSGLLVGSADAEVRKIAVCLDITNAIIEESAKNGADLIVSHHPVIFKGIKKLDMNSPVYRLAALGITAVCLHTPIDMARGGISDMMLELMGFGSAVNAPVLDIIDHKSGLGYGRIAALDNAVTADELAAMAKKAFKCTSVKYTDGGKPIKTVALSSGAGNDEVYTCIERGIDALITGDVKHHGFVDASIAGLTVIDAGHYHTEVIVCDYLKKIISGKFPQAEVFIPESNAEVCKYI